MLTIGDYLYSVEQYLIRTEIYIEQIKHIVKINSYQLNYLSLELFGLNSLIE